MRGFVLLAVAILSQTSFADLATIVERPTPFPGSTLYVPNDGKPHPGILVLHGSEGGSLPYYQLDAQFLAAQGYAALAYCWYNCQRDPIRAAHLPLENVELEKTLNAYRWLKASSHVQNRKTALLGVSRGAEQALILGWLTTRDGGDVPDAIAVHAPSDTVVMGFSWAAIDNRCWFSGLWNPACGPMPKDPSKTTVTAWRWQGKPLAHGTRIEIEKYRGPVFIAHGTRDEWWSHERSLAIQKSLVASGNEPEVHILEGEKHVFTPAAETRKKEWLLNFLKKNLAPAN